MNLPPWQIFNRVPNAEKIAAGLNEIPSHWSLTPLQEKSPRRKGWQTEDFIPQQNIAALILNGDEAVSSKTGKTYRRYWSGYGLRLGEASNGLLAIDIDGASAQPILEAISGGNIPPTVSWSSGKPGRYQLLFQIPESLRGNLQEFTRSIITEWDELQTLRDETNKPLELLEFRYNRCQSALPPSLHPSTGAYHWVNSPVDTEVAFAPDWLCSILIELADGERRDEEAKLQAKLNREKIIKESGERRKALGIIGSIDLVDAFSQSVARLSPEDIFNWPGHNFKQRGHEWFGCCPQHQSQSGESFTVEPDTLDWYCYGCNVGGGVGEYRHFVNGGKGTPRGRDFFEVVKKLAEKAGVTLPPQSVSIPNQPSLKIRSQKPGNLQVNKINHESPLSPRSTTFDILNPPLVASPPTLSLRDGMFKILSIPESIASFSITEEKNSGKTRRWFERILNRVKKVLSKSAKKDKTPRLGFNCFKEDNPDFEEKIRQIQRKLRSLSYAADINLASRYLPNELVNQLPKSGLIGIKAPKGCGKSVLLKKVIALAKKQGIPVLSITPRIALGREQAIKWEITWIDDYGVMQTRADDTTRQIAEIADKRAQAKEKLAELEKISYQQLDFWNQNERDDIEQQKNNLRAEIEQYDEQIENINAASIKTLALCWDSLWRTKDRDLREALIVIDEAELGFKHFISGSTCKRNRPYLLKVFKDKLVESLMSGGRVILSDADLTDLPINYVREILPIPLKPFIVKNEYIGDKTRCVVDFRMGSRGNTLTEILAVIRNGAYLTITSDSQAEAQALEKLILQKFPDDFCAFLDTDGNITGEAQARKKALIVRIDRKTTESEAGKKFIQKPNEQILNWKPRVLIYTPSMGVGVSIDESTQREEGEMVPYFDAVYSLFFGVIEPSQCRQQLARVRANVPRIIWCKEFNRALEGCSSFFPEEVKRQTLKYNQSALNILDIAKGIAGYEADDEEIRKAMLQLLTEAWDKDSRCWREPSIDLASAFKARENYGLWNLASLLKEELEDEGHTVVSLEGAKNDLVEQMADIKDDQKAEEATLIAEAPLMPVEEARKVINSLGETKERQRSAQKSLLQEELPEINLTPEFVKKAVVDDRRRWLNQQKLFWYFTNDEAVRQIDTDHWLSHLRKFAEGTPFMRDIRSYSPKIEALKKSGIFEFINLEDCDRVYEGDTSEAEKFLKQCLRYKDDLQTALNVLVTKNTTPISLANRILSKVGLKLKKLTRSKKDNRWKLSVELVNDPDRINVLKAFDLRWRISQEEAEYKMAEKSAQTQSQQAIEMGGQSPSYIDTKTDRPPIEEERSQVVMRSMHSGAAALYLDEPKTLVPQSQQAIEVGGQSPSYINQNMDRPPIIEEGSQSVKNLVEAIASCESSADFAAAIEGCSDEMIEDAIALSDTQPRRQQLSKWHEQLSQESAGGGAGLAHEQDAETLPPVKTHVWDKLPTVGSVVTWVGGTQRLILKAIDPDGVCQVWSCLSGMFSMTRVDQLQPASS